MGKTILSILAVFAAFSAGFAAQPVKSFKSGQIMPDENGLHINAHGGGFLFYEGKYYWFGEHKTEGKAGNLAQVGVRCYSSADLYNWKDEGVVFKVDEDPSSEVTKGCIIERPKVLFNEKTGKFVMWFHLEFKKGDKPDYSTARCALAVADKITGPYVYKGSFRPQKGLLPQSVRGLAEIKRILAEESDEQIAKTASDNSRKVLRGNGYAFARDFRGQGQMARDMTLFKDEDGKAYLICASEENATLQIHELNEDYTGFTGRYARAFEASCNEAPAIFKWGGRYYMITSGCSGWAPNAARSAVANDIMGPWTSLGNPCRGAKKDCDTTFGGQSTFVIPVEGNKNAFIFVGDIWRPDNAVDGRYIFLPIEFEEAKPVIRFKDEWDLSIFNPAQ